MGSGEISGEPTNASTQASSVSTSPYSRKTMPTSGQAYQKMNFSIGIFPFLGSTPTDIE